MKESQFQAKVVKYLRSLPNTWLVNIWGGGFQTAGVPDVIACINGRFIALELKVEQGRASPLQSRNIEKINEAGGYARVVYPKDWEELKLKLAEMGRLTDGRI